MKHYYPAVLAGPCGFSDPSSLPGLQRTPKIRARREAWQTASVLLFYNEHSLAASIDRGVFPSATWGRGGPPKASMQARNKEAYPLKNKVSVLLAKRVFDRQHDQVICRRGSWDR